MYSSFSVIIGSMIDSTGKDGVGVGVLVGVTVGVLVGVGDTDIVVVVVVTGSIVVVVVVTSDIVYVKSLGAQVTVVQTGQSGSNIENVSFNNLKLCLTSGADNGSV